MSKKKSEQETDVDDGAEESIAEDNENGEENQSVESTARPVRDVPPNAWDHGPGRAKT